MTFQRITEIIKEHYEHGTYSGHMFRMTPGTLVRFKKGFAPEMPNDTPEYARALTSNSMLVWLAGIPIVADNSMPPDEWQLCPIAQSGIIEQGNILHAHDGTVGIVNLGSSHLPLIVDSDVTATE